MNYTKYNPRCYSETKWSGGDDGDSDGDDDDDPDEARRDDDDDGDDFPPSGKEFPRHISPCRRAFLSLVFSASWRRRNISSMSPLVLGFLGVEVREGGAPEVGQGTARPRGHPRRGVTWAPGGPL